MSTQQSNMLAAQLPLIDMTAGVSFPKANGMAGKFWMLSFLPTWMRLHIITEHWLKDLNIIRPHEALQDLPPRPIVLQTA